MKKNLSGIVKKFIILTICCQLIVTGFLTNPGSLNAAYPDFTISKGAKVLSTGNTDLGTATSPVPVQIGDEIEYTLKIGDYKGTQTGSVQKYDIVFVMDWSGSMTYTGFRVSAKNTILEMSRRVFANYPDSRISVMGLNCYDNNTNAPNQLFLQIDTDFVGAAQYNSVIANAYASNPTYVNDDVPIFIQAATNKLAGIQKSYGGVVVPSRQLKVRDDFSRIPVMVVVSDFEVGDLGIMGGSWSNVNKEVTNFKNLLPEGILLAVKTESATMNKIGYNSNAHLDLISNTINMGGGRWGWTYFQASMTQAQQDEALWDLMGDYVPNYVYPSATITDELPAGLEYVSSTGGGVKTTVGGKDTVTWNISELDPNQTTVTVRAKVKEEGYFVNKATVKVGTFAPEETNATYHATYGDLTITKEDSADSTQKLDGAVFEIWDTNGTPATSDDVLIAQTAPTDTSGLTTASLPSGRSYRFVETTVPNGYKTPLNGNITAAELKDTSTIPGPNDGTFTVNESKETATITNAKEGLDFTFTKIDGNAFAADGTVKPLSGAEFALYKCITPGKEEDLVPFDVIHGTGTSSDWQELPYRITTGNDGIVTFPVLEDGFYMLVETKAPSTLLTQYVLPTGQWSIKIASSQATPITKKAIPGADSQLPPGFTLDGQLLNIQQHNLPLTGGLGIAIFTISGTLILAIVLVLFIINNRRLPFSKLLPFAKAKV